MSTLILGLAAYPQNRVWEAVDLLARSVRKNAPASRLAVITTPLGAQDRRRFDRFCVTALEFVDPVPEFDLATAQGRDARRSWVLALYAARHRLYIRALERINETHVLLSDTRDAVVTSSFEHISVRTKLLLSQEDSRQTLASDPWNRRWLVDGYGEETINRIGHERILCAGAVFGPLGVVRDYVTAMTREADRLGPSIIQQIGDQPMHNYLAYTGQLPDFDVSRAEDGCIRSIGVMPLKDVGLEWSCPPFTRPGHDRAVVIHQYDRHWTSRRMKHAVWRAAGLGVVSQYARALCRRAGWYATGTKPRA